MPGAAKAMLCVLVVDDNNTVGSVLAERLLRRHIALRGLSDQVICVTSAGFDATEGAPMEPAAVQLLEEYGADTTEFAARALTEEILADANITIVGSRADRDALLERHPLASARVFRMTEMAELYDFIVASAPLHEHAGILHSARQAALVPDHYDLAQPARTPDALLTFADQVDKGAAWLAEVWASMAPEAPGPRAIPASVGTVVDIPLDAFGVAVMVRCTGSERDELAREVARIWSRCVRMDAREPEVEIEAFVDPDPERLTAARLRRAVAQPDVFQAMHSLSSTVTVRAIDARRGELVMLHAAGIAVDSGDVIAFVAPSGTGKTTIARILGRHFSYVTDETLAVTADGTVLPYPKPLSLVTDHGEGIKDQWGPESLGLRVPPSQLRLARIVILDRDVEGPAVPELRPMELLEGLAALASQVSYLSLLPQKLHTLADLVHSVGGVHTLRYREATSIMGAIATIMAGSE